MASEHTAKAFDSDLQELTRLVAEMGGLAERMIIESVDALIRRDVALGKRVVAADAEIDRLQQRDRGARGADHRPAPADGDRSARDRRRHAGRDRSGADRRPRQEHGQARRGAGERFPAAEADPRPRAHDRPRAVAGQVGAGRLCGARSAGGDGGLEGRRGSRRHLHLAVPRTPDLHDGRSAQHLVLHPSDVLRQEHRADRRPRHQHRRDRVLHDRGPADARQAAEGRHDDVRHDGTGTPEDR